MVSPQAIKNLSIPAYKNVLLETADVIMIEADAKVHVITGRTKASGTASIPSKTQITITYSFGGVWEERRGSPHDFLHQGTLKGQKEMPKIVQKYITDIVQAGLAGRSPRFSTFIGKRVSKKTGKVYYIYSKSGGSSRGTGRRSGIQRR